MTRRFGALGATLLLVAFACAVSRPASAQRPGQPAQGADKRDRVVAAPGTPFNGKAYWQSAAQCGGIYFKVGTFYSEEAIKAQVIKPDPAAYEKFTRSAQGATRNATAFFEAAERFLIADRKITREEAVLAYDPISTAAGDRAKTLDAALQATKPCPDLYQTCRATYPQACNDNDALAD